MNLKRIIPTVLLALLASGAQAQNYPNKTVRIVEFPRYELFAQSFPKSSQAQFQQFVG